MASDLEKIYEEIENAESYRYDHQIADRFVAFANTLSPDDSLRTTIQWEIDAFNFTDRKGKIMPKFLGTDDKGQPVEYPSFQRFTDPTYDYFQKRHEDVRHPILKNRYATLLWNSPRKHTKYAQSAIEESLKLIEIYTRLDREKPTEHYGLDVMDSVETAFLLTKDIKGDTAQVEDLIIDILRNYSFESSSSFALRAELIELAIEHKLQAKRFKGIFVLINKIAENLKNAQNFHAAIRMYELGHSACKYLKKSNCSDWIRKQARCYESLMRTEREGNEMATVSFCRDAMDLYKSLGDTKKVATLEKRFDQLKSKVKFHTISTSVDTTDLYKQIEEASKKLAEKPTEAILSVLTHAPYILPDIGKTQDLVNNLKKESVVMNIFSTQLLDSNLNTADHFVTDEEKNHFQLLSQYRLSIEMEKGPLINAVIFEAMRRNPSFFRETITYLNQNSWYGKELRRQRGENVVKFTWLSVIAPALNDYMAELQKLISGHISVNPVLALDSLTLKVEGLIRDLCHLKKISTTYFKEGKNGKQLSEEADLAYLLGKKELEGLISKEDLFFFKFLLTEKAGYNLRHEIAHSLMVYQQYSITFINLLFVVILRLGKYNLTSSKKTEK